MVRQCLQRSVAFPRNCCNFKDTGLTLGMFTIQIEYNMQNEVTLDPSCNMADVGTGRSRTMKLSYLLFGNRNQQTSSIVLGSQVSLSKIEQAFQARDKEARQANNSADFGVSVGHWLALVLRTITQQSFLLSKKPLTQVSYFRGTWWVSNTLLPILTSTL